MMLNRSDAASSTERANCTSPSSEWIIIIANERLGSWWRDRERCTAQASRSFLPVGTIISLCNSPIVIPASLPSKTQQQSHLLGDLSPAASNRQANTGLAQPHTGASPRRTMLPEISEEGKSHSFKYHMMLKQGRDVTSRAAIPKPWLKCSR